MWTYTYTQENLEETADAVKTEILRALTVEGKFTGEEADEWCKTHTIIFRKKNIFQTISNLWRKSTEIENGFYIIVVKQV